MIRKLKTGAGILAVVLCIFPGCARKDAGREDLLLLPVSGMPGSDMSDSDMSGVDASAPDVSDTGASSPGAAGQKTSAAEETGSDQGAGRSGESPAGGDGVQAAAEGAKERTEERNCVVHICGAVNCPGVYVMEPGSRVYQALERAGGFGQEADEDYLNQADLLSDGMKIYVPTRAEVEEAGGRDAWRDQSGNTGAAREDSSPGPSLVNINTAGEEELCTLPGVGSSKARSIIAYREKHGAYQKIEDIMNVEGIKDGVYQKIRDSITV